MTLRKRQNGPVFALKKQPEKDYGRVKGTGPQEKDNEGMRRGESVPSRPQASTTDNDQSLLIQY